MDKLLEPIEIAGLRFKNRMVHVATTMNMSDPLGHVTDKLIAAYETLAAGGSSAVIVGATCVRHDGLINERMLGLYDDTYVIGQRDVVEVIRHNDSLAGIQLFYGGMIPGIGSTFPLKPGEGWIPGTIAWGPSNAYAVGNPQPLVMPTEVYDEVVEAYAQAGRRAREAGYEFLSYHFCHGSLPHTNLSLLVNTGRTDKYADRFLLCERILERTQELCGKEFPLIPRFCVDECLEGGFDIDYFVDNYAPRLHALGVAVLDCTFGSMLNAPSRNPDITAWENIGPGFYTPNAVNLSNIAYLKQRLREKGIDMPVIGSANLCTPEHLREMVQDGRAEFAGSCRLSMDDPDYANKIAEGREDEVRKSTRTGASLLQGNIFTKGWAGSAQNAAFGRDREYRIRPTAHPKKVVVVGGGVGGMEYAITAKQIGHDVVLLERSGQLGGTMAWAGNYAKVPNMEIIAYQSDWHKVMMDKLGVAYRLNCDATADLVLALKPDIAVIATGSEWAIPEIEGLDEARAGGFAVTIEEAMASDGAFDPGPSPVIFGSAMGGELAIDYALRGLAVRLIDARPQHRAINYLGSRGPKVLAFMEKLGLAIESNVQPVALGEGEVRVTNGSGNAKAIPASSFVICPERKPADALVAQLRGSGVSVQVLGDARNPRSAGNAVHEAAYLARQIG